MYNIYFLTCKALTRLRLKIMSGVVKRVSNNNKTPTHLFTYTHSTITTCLYISLDFNGSSSISLYDIHVLLVKFIMT